MGTITIRFAVRIGIAVAAPIICLIGLMKARIRE